MSAGEENPFDDLVLQDLDEDPPHQARSSLADDMPLSWELEANEGRHIDQLSLQPAASDQADDVVQAAVTREQTQKLSFAFEDSPAPKVETPAIERSPIARPKAFTTGEPEPVQSTPVAPPAAKIVIYDDDAARAAKYRTIKYALAGSVIGALGYAIFMIVSLGTGQRLSLLALAFFSAFGARLGTDNYRGNEVRFIAAYSAALAVVIAKLFLAIGTFWMVSSMSSDGSEEMLAHYTGTISSYYQDGEMEAVDEILDTGDNQDIEVEEVVDEADEKETLNDSSSIKLSVISFFLMLFGVGDIFCIIAAMMLAWKLAKEGYD